MPRLLQHWVNEQASRRPTNTALVSGGDRLSYADLEARSNQLARLLKDSGCRRGDRIALLTPKTPMAIAALLGIYKADCTYVPLDPASPASRLAGILDSCEIRSVIAGGPVAPRLAELLADGSRPSLRIGALGELSPSGEAFPTFFTLDDLAAYSAEPVDCRNESDDPAHILFTSGSTGTPKGVVITHASVIHFVEWATKYFGMDASDRVSAHPPLHFDMSFFDIFGAAAVGAEIHLVGPQLNVMPNHLASFIRESALTQWFSVPSSLNYMAKFDVVGFGDLPALRRVLWAGEVLPTTTLMHWMNRLPHVRFTNLYGPTETTISSSYYTVPACPDDPLAAIPIGTACEGEELLVLNEDGSPADRGETGQLYIGGVGLAREYWRDQERTAAAFVRHPRRLSERIYKTGDLARVGDDGLVYFLGRNDSQIKSRGYRIELGEIEAALYAVPDVQDGAVVALDTCSFEGAVICCAYATAIGKHVSPVTVRRELGRLIPGYMLPAHLLQLDRLPTNANGKIDRSRLKSVFKERLDAHAAQTA